MSTHQSALDVRIAVAERAIHAATVTIAEASGRAMIAATTPQRQAAISEATEHAHAALRGIRRALRADWLDD